MFLFIPTWRNSLSFILRVIDAAEKVEKCVLKSLGLSEGQTFPPKVRMNNMASKDCSL